MFLDAAVSGRLTLDRTVELLSTAPARAFGLSQKGRLEVGADADVVIVDLDRDFEITDEIVLSKIGYTPYAGMRVRGVVEATLVRGRPVYENGAVVGSRGWVARLGLPADSWGSEALMPGDTLPHSPSSTR